jgi:tetratricopeptide (TPR) repeat protein
VTAKVVGAIEPEMRRAETARARRRPTDNPDAHLCLLRGLASLDKWNKAGIDEAMRLAHQAIELDPAYSGPYGLALSCYIIRKANRWVADVAQDRAETVRLTAQAVEVGRDDAISLSLSGFAIAYVLDDLDAGAILIDRALAITPNFAMVLGHSGYVRVWLGEPQLAIDHLQRAMRLSPVDPLFFMMQAALAMAHFIAGRDDEAFAWAEKAAQRNPFFAAATWTAAASAANLGRSEDAAKYVARLRQIDPGVTIPTIEERLSLRRRQDRARLIDSLRMAGLAE